MPAHDVWLVLPSANPANAARTFPVWRERGYRIAVLQDRVRFACDADRVVTVDRYEGWAASVNVLCREVVPKTAASVVGAGDDMLPDPTKSAQQIAEEFLERFPSGLGVMQPQGDAYLNSHQFCGSPWFGRGWIDRMYGGRGVMFPEYRHNWADNEVYWLARCGGALWERPDLTQHHEHFSREKGSEPAYWSASAREFDRLDAELFVSRAWAGFPGHESVGSEFQFDRDRFAREYRFLAEVHLATKHGVPSAAERLHKRFRHMLDECVERGFRRVAIYGAGSHTRAISPVLSDSPIELACIIDDNPSTWGSTVAGLKVVSPEQAMALDLDAVLLSSNTMEAKLAVSARPLAEQGVAVIPLYGDSCASHRQFQAY